MNTFLVFTKFLEKFSLEAYAKTYVCRDCFPTKKIDFKKICSIANFLSLAVWLFSKKLGDPFLNRYFTHFVELILVEIICNDFRSIKSLIAVVGNHRAAAQCWSVRSSLPGRLLFQIKCFETFL